MKIILNDVQGRAYRCPNCNTLFVATHDSWLPPYAKDMSWQHSHAYCPRCGATCISKKSDPYITIKKDTCVVNIITK